MKCKLFTFFSVTLLIPFPSLQHFVWPLHWCLLADICNHTWIPECGEEDEEDSTRRLFIDECDMYEYNCDYERDYDMVNYSDCFAGVTGCPTRLPCPSRPPCPNHQYHRMGEKFTTPPRMYQTHSRTRRIKTTPDLPEHMLKGRRRYTPKPLRKKRHTKTTPKTNNVRKTALKTEATTLKTIIIRKETIVKNGRTFVKVIRGLVKKKGPSFLKGFDADDFLEK